MGLRGLSDGLAVGNLRRPRLQLDSVTLLHAGQDDVDVQVPHPGQHVVVRLRVLLEGESAVLVQGLGDGVAQLVLVRTALGDDRHAVDGAGILDLLELTGGTALDGQGVPDLRALELGDRDDVAGSLRHYR